MELTRLKYLLLFFSLMLIPSSLLSAIDEKTTPGTYRSKEHRNNIIVLYLRPDHSALIVDKFWDTGNYKDHTENNFRGTWEIEGDEIIITYNGIKQILTYHEKLSLGDYGINDGVPGLTTSDNNTNYGLLDSSKLWHQDELKRY